MVPQRTGCWQTKPCPPKESYPASECTLLVNEVFSFQIFHESSHPSSLPFIHPARQLVYLARVLALQKQVFLLLAPALNKTSKTIALAGP